MKLANRGEVDIKKSSCQNAAFLCTKISLIPMFSYMRSLYTDRISSEKIFSELLLPSSQCPWCTAKCTISLGKNEIYPISIHRGYNKLHLEPGVNHWHMSLAPMNEESAWLAEQNPMGKISPEWSNDIRLIR